DGVLTDMATPWAPSGRSHGRDELALNLFVLERFHERLLSFYTRIPSLQVGLSNSARAEQQTDAGEGSTEETTEVVALACRALAEDGRSDETEDEEPEDAPRRQIPRLRARRLIALLRKRFNCGVRQGRGSEIVISRTGGRPFILGMHKRNPEIHPVKVCQLL